jgi:hypothetical protein
MAKLIKAVAAHITTSLGRNKKLFRSLARCNKKQSLTGEIASLI